MIEPYFNRLHPKYKCCCSLMHVETGTKIICILATIGYILSFFNWLENGPQALWGTWGLGRIVLGAIMVIGPLVGISKTKPQYFLPYLCYLGISMCFAVIEILFCLIAYDRGSSWGRTLRRLIKEAFVAKARTESRIDEIIDSILLALILSFIFNVWFFVVIRKCYNYVKDKVASGYNELTIP
uniref:Uncharacterized protein n=1 Tax=Panagrolaimus davidi TaxID=227884 RepID=A0A914QEM4_9BILA